ncbi:MAG: hypothetical protein DID91_2727703296 [Candidatus Nitrotoga sp. MKT]|nr:MAG: hypothetical protein DID91_2727703296 [Candidatus Nitrotoga sp. MKT]
MRRDVNREFKHFHRKPGGVGGLADALRRGYGGNGASTSMYWIPLYGIPTARGLVVNLAGKKYLRSQAARCSRLHVAVTVDGLGLLSGTFRLMDEICILRAALQQRDCRGT